MENQIEARKLNKTFSLSKTNTNHVLKDVDLDIKKGEFIAVMGPSGSGKSTLLYNVSGMDYLTSGDLLFKEKKLNELKERDLAKVRLNTMGFIFQQSHLLKDLSILDNVLLPGYTSDKFTKKEVDQRAHILMERLGISAIKNNKINEASGGQLQRVSIARALINQPEILFADEPTGALNSSASDEVLSILKSINDEETTVLIVTHDPKVASYAERVLYICDGRIESEKHLGTFTNIETIHEREASLIEWLTVCGF